MDSCLDCCGGTAEDQGTGKAVPQHHLLFPRVMASVTSPLASKDAPANPYEILQVRRDATPQEIRQSFKRMALLNHPGREATTAEERLRRWQSFNLIAACYETLMEPESRRRYDSLCRELARSRMQAGVRGALFVGGRPLRSGSFDDDDLQGDPASRTVSFGGSSLVRRNGQKQENLPLLSRSSSDSSSTEDNEASGAMDHDESCCFSQEQGSSFTSPSKKSNRVVTAATLTTKGSVAAPSLMDAASTEEDEEAEAHYTQSTTQRLFGGPLSNLFKARNFEAFSDPYDVFEDAFGSQPFPRISRKDISCTEEEAAATTPTTTEKSPTIITTSPATTPRSTSGWRGNKRTTPDGNITVYTTSRIVHDRLLTRTETVTRTPGGKTKTHISVTAEPLTPTATESTKENDCISSNACLTICSRTTTTSPEHKGMCEDACVFYENVVQQLDFTREEFMEEWRRMLSYNSPFHTSNV